MTILAGHNLAVYVNGVDISGDLNEVNPKSEIELADIPTFGKIGHCYYPGLANDEFDYKGLFNPISGALASQLTTLFGTDTSYGVMIVKGSAAAAVVGDAVSAANGVKLAKYLAKIVTTDVIWLDASFKVENYPFSNGILMFPKAQKTADANGDTVNNAAPTTDGAVGFIQVFEQTGGTGCTISIRHSTDNFVADDTELLTFGNFATAGVPTSLRVAATGTVKQYVRVKFVFAGGGPYTCTCAISLERL